jgi:aldehyde dehydrogenase (NAD+)
VIAAIKHDLKHLEKYMTNEFTETEMLLFPGSTLIQYEPLGVVAIYSAWNYPVSLALKPVANAITAGNCVIMKPSEISPHVSKVIAKLFDKYMDHEFFRCIEGGVDVAVELNKQPLDLICFTGSTFVGKIIAKTAAKNLTPCILELGGKCPTVVHPTCSMDHTTDKLSWAKFSNTGQTCIAPDYLFVHEEMLDGFVKALIDKVKLHWGESEEGSDQSGHIVSKLHFDRLAPMITNSGGKLLYGGKTNEKKLHIQPTIILNPNEDSLLMTDEIFGPILPIKTYKHIDECIEYINDRSKPLAVYFYGKQNHADAIKLSN